MNINLLDKINSPDDLKKLKKSEIPILADEIRNFLIRLVHKNGGHLASNLGVVELTLALHFVFNSPEDKFVWDVGHQTYTHKLLTGRKKELHTLRQFKGISGFPKISESIHDVFGTGHSSTSISAALGMSEAMRKNKSKNKAIAIIGDGAMTAGMAFEGLNNAGNSKSNILVILNDNDMSISNNVGALNNYLTRLLSGKVYSELKSTGKKILGGMPSILKLARKTEEHVKGMITPGTLFEEFGFNYLGPIDGHNINLLIDTLKNIKNLNGPQFLHIVTKKGFGYKPAEKDPNKFHGISNLETTKKNKTFTESFEDWILKTAAKDKKLCAITPAMSDGSGLSKFSKKYSNQFYDVGIAEQHAVTFACGLSLAGLKPVVAIYSTFLQRAYDQVIHDAAIQKISLVFAVDRAGIVGADGSTHTGNFDISFIRCIPNTIIMCPINEFEMHQMLDLAYSTNGLLSFVRYPRGSLPINKLSNTKVLLGKSQLIFKSKKQEVAIFAFGNIANQIYELCKLENFTLINMRFVKPIDVNTVINTAKKFKILVTIEDNAISGGAGSSVNELLAQKKIIKPILNIGYGDFFPEHGSQDEINQTYGLDNDSIISKIKNFLTKKIV